MKFKIEINFDADTSVEHHIQKVNTDKETVNIFMNMLSNLVQLTYKFRKEHDIVLISVSQMFKTESKDLEKKD